MTLSSKTIPPLLRDEADVCSLKNAFTFINQGIFSNQRKGFI